MITVFTNAAVFDGLDEEIVGGTSVVVEGGRIKEVTPRKIKLPKANYIDCHGRVLMPGLIDAHFHANTPSFDFYSIDRMPASLLASHAKVILEGALRRGFTTVRDAGGGDVGLWLAIEQRLISGPRFFYAGKAISQTGGHGDMRPHDAIEPCLCGHYHGSFSMLVDGPDEMRKAVRQALSKGSHHIKLFLSGGVASPNDPIWMSQFSEEEIRVAVYEASTRRAYVMAHCHTNEAARRCVEYGIRSIEHGTSINSETAKLISENNVYVVPTLSVVDVVGKYGVDIGLREASAGKVQGLYEQMLRSIEICTQAGVKLGLGTDLLGHAYHPLQGGELALRGEVNSAIDVLRSATSVNAELLQKSGELGCIKPDAYADILVLEGNPLEDLSLFGNSEKNIPLIMRGGEMIRNHL